MRPMSPWRTTTSTAMVRAIATATITMRYRPAERFQAGQQCRELENDVRTDETERDAQDGEVLRQVGVALREVNTRIELLVTSQERLNEQCANGEQTTCHDCRGKDRSHPA